MRLLSITVLTLTLFGSCERDRGRVEVRDASGKPVAGARLCPVHELFIGQAVVTDARGTAVVAPEFVFGASPMPFQYIRVEKEGFAPQSIKPPKQWPLKIVLEPARRP